MKKNDRAAELLAAFDKEVMRRRAKAAEESKTKHKPALDENGNGRIEDLDRTPLWRNYKYE